MAKRIRTPKITRKLRARAMPRHEPAGFKDKAGVTLYIPVIPMSGNRWIRLHGLARNKFQTDLGWFFKAAETRVKDQKRSDCKARVLAIRVSTRKIGVDVDNLYTGLKPFVDWLTKLGWLKDDNPTWLEYPKPEQMRPTYGLKPGVYLRIEYLDDATVPTTT